MLSYERFRTGLTYAEVSAMMFSASADPADWRYRGRSGVLGFWRQLKQEMYAAYTDEHRQNRPHRRGIRH